MQFNSNFSEKNFQKQAKKDGITHISTGVAILRNAKILLIRRAADDFLGGVYELPGGGVDDNETITEGAIREVKEETGLTVSKIISIFDGFDYSTNKKPLVRQVNFLVEVDPGNVILDPSEHDEFIWVNKGNIKNLNMTNDMRKCIKEALKFIS